MRMKNKTLALAAALLLAGGLPLRADEGMWMVNALARALVQKMEGKGLQLSAREIYAEDAVSLKDAIVSLDFGCSGSMVSPDGLLITNHHCAYGDVHALSTPGHNYLEDGFWAHTRGEEIPIPGKKVFFLKRVIDVTGEVEALKKELGTAGKPMGMRKVSYIMEKRYGTQTGWEASLSSMWAGSRYYMALYRVYDDVRLVAAPPVSIAAFGGDVDNWEWPQQKCDFAMYRIYEDGEPWHPDRWLDISRAGIREGDFAMVMGYPGRTDRYASAAKIRFATEVTLPVSNEARGAQMAILKRHMDADPAVRLKYADRFFMLSNVQELQEGEVQCCRRFGVEREVRAREAASGLPSPLLEELDRCYGAIADAERNRTWYRETLIRGTQLALVATRLKGLSHKHSHEREKQVMKAIGKDYSGMDPRVEKDLLRYCIEAYYEHVDGRYWGPYQKELKERFGSDYDALLAHLWTDAQLRPDDRLSRFFNDVDIVRFNREIDSLTGHGKDAKSLSAEYTRTLWALREAAGEPQYPDANSTMRLTYGTVRGYSPKDGVSGLWQSTHTGILEKADPDDYDFALKPEWEKLLRAETSPLPANFITDNDITGGNSGSPVLNAKGELIGLAFDGNKESLASDFAFTDGYNRCVCVDIRFVLWTLEHYAGMTEVLAEMSIIPTN